MPFSHRWVLNWVWTCLIFQCFDTYGPHAGARHYSSFKYRILDCFTDSNFTKPHSKTAGDKSRDRPQVIYHFSKTKQDWDNQVLLKVGKKEAAFEGGMFYKQRYQCISSIAARYSSLGALWRNLTTVKSAFKHTEPQAIIRSSILLKVSYAVWLWTSFTPPGYKHHISLKYMKRFEKLTLIEVWLRVKAQQPRAQEEENHRC